MFTISLIKLNLFSSFLLDVTRGYFTLFAITSQLSGVTAAWKIKRKLLIEKQEAASDSYS